MIRLGAHAPARPLASLTFCVRVRAIRARAVGGLAAGQRRGLAVGRRDHPLVAGAATAAAAAAISGGGRHVQRAASDGPVCGPARPFGPPRGWWMWGRWKGVVWALSGALFQLQVDAPGVPVGAGTWDI
jgi:hypothetical protein